MEVTLYWLLRVLRSYAISIESVLLALSFRYNGLITQCWVALPEKRHSFLQVTKILNSLLEDVAGYMDFSAICGVDETVGRYDHLPPPYDHLAPGY